MKKEKKFSPELREMLSKAQPITRKWLVTINPDEVDTMIKNKFIFLNTVERNIYAKWHQQCLKEMKKTKLHTCVPEIYKVVSDSTVTLDKALAYAQKAYTREENEKRREHIGRMITKLQTLHRNETKLYQEATQALLNGEAETCLEDIAIKLSSQNELENEDFLFTDQCIKHFNCLMRNYKNVEWKELFKSRPIDSELKLALNAKFASESEIFTAQVNIVAGTYKEGQDVPTDIKDICFEYIKESIRYAGYFHVVLMEYIFKNDEISERAYNLFVETEDIIRKSGMAVMPKMYANRLAKKLGLYTKEVTALTDSDIRILRIEEMFSSK